MAHVSFARKRLPLGGGGVLLGHLASLHGSRRLKVQRSGSHVRTRGLSRHKQCYCAVPTLRALLYSSHLLY